MPKDRNMPQNPDQKLITNLSSIPAQWLGIFDRISNGVMITDCDSMIVYSNPAFTRITGYSAEEVLGKNPGMLHSGRHDKQYYEEMWKRIKETGTWEGEIWNRRKSGEIFPEYLTISSLIDISGFKCNLIAIISDITYLKKDTYHQLKLSFYDPLTELPNRSLFKDRVNLAINQAQDNPTMKHAFLFMDLDKFKQVNDTYGHLVGDYLLKSVGKRLIATMRSSDTVARIGGDEFTAILFDIKDKARVDRLARRIIEDIEKPFTIDGHVANISISIGISFFPTDETSFEGLMNNADKAMYTAKKEKTKIQFFDELTTNQR